MSTRIKKYEPLINGCVKKIGYKKIHKLPLKQRANLFYKEYISKDNNFDKKFDINAVNEDHLNETLMDVFGNYIDNYVAKVIEKEKTVGYSGLSKVEKVVFDQYNKMNKKKIDTIKLNVFNYVLILLVVIILFKLLK